jgi:hypothetical protein
MLGKSQQQKRQNLRKNGDLPAKNSPDRKTAGTRGE